ncbi:MAG: tRNA preQ1(34) S-adenosylmethionine ribosyltransferase-isomerase QueA [Gammaproteobacteria bacterium]|nr:tRNA preQ1(34) S-adenosylmethionine ribosyltransferase-isomerase QueA [Gammaproteobacteria bacterium]MDH4313816.1 tRNA preQ1(34) S-adenosylmethionine ribosyltransferase-isomerase QueA [Gammaproteobacteria bacterium]MDH5214817.1 tRNA preQ1(34) S-adenosylmethionine ribosyltransferase-isomerase QueA [Gammaproteobacteria bacterium]
MQLSDFDYELPDELIARFPPERRRDSRLLVANAATRQLTDSGFAKLGELLREGDLLVFNDTRVIPARLHGRKETGGRIEILIERVSGERSALALLRSSKVAKVGMKLEFPGGATATVTGRAGDFFLIDFSLPIEPYLERHGETPLPPYLGRDADAADGDRYQTVYAKRPGAVAAPTAGLHFDTDLLEETRRQGVQHAFVTLHVGAGTFQNLREEMVSDNRLHAERVTVGDATSEAICNTRASGGRVIAVGTTTVRALEAASRDGTVKPFSGETDLFILPGYRFRSVDALLTNFHLPRSSLLMLVAAFAGRQFVLEAYRHAVAGRYRFFSYGDAMFIVPKKSVAHEI